jgi:hypothetical protein
MCTTIQLIGISRFIIIIIFKVSERFVGLKVRPVRINVQNVSQGLHATISIT